MPETTPTPETVPADRPHPDPSPDPTPDPLSAPPATPPDGLYALVRDALRGHKRLLALRAALTLGLFEATAPLRAETLAAQRGLHAPALAPLLEVLAEAGLLEPQDHGFVPTAAARTWLTRRSPLYQGAVLENAAETLALWGRLEDVLRSGPLNPVAEGLFGGAFLPALAAEALSGEARRTADRLLETPGFDAVDEVLDLGGGHALYALALAARLPGLRAEVLDLPSARPLAEGHIQRFGGGDGRVRFRAGDIFHADLGRGRQAVLLFYSPGGKRPDLLERIHACLAPGGFFVSKHAFYAADEGRKDPLLDLEWRLSAFPGTAKGPRVYEFQGDLDRDAYRAELAARFDIVAEHEAPAFAAPDLGKFGDRLDSRLIIARKR